MSTTSTPSRARPALVIPGLDNKGQFDVKTSMMSCHGLPTPPQSALESRRPSLQFSTIAEYAPSVVSTVGSFSQPSTPVRGVSRHGEAYSNSWTEHAATTTNTPSNLVHSLTATHLSQPLLQPAFQSQHSYQPSEIAYLEAYTDATSQTASSFGNEVDVQGHHSWSSQHVQHPSTAEVSGLGPTLFAMSHDLGQENNTQCPLGMQGAATYHHHQPFQPSIESFHAYATAHSNIYSQPQVVVPSQLSPQDDFSQQQYHALTSPQHCVGSYSTSFSSSAGSLGDFDVIRPPSPTSAYFAQSDDEDYVHVGKFEGTESPSYNASLRRSIGSRSRRRGSKRVRNTGASYIHTHYTGNTEVVCENFKPEDIDPNEPFPVRLGGLSKKHRCTHLLDNGMECGVSFERGEHLKRHSGKHSEVRNYPCPLPNCDKRIQRPDNAADHFKTHLKPAKPGKRNKHFDWRFVRHAIEQNYKDSKRAHKLLDNLQKWIDAGMPESASQRRGARL